MIMNETIEKLINKLELLPHPEGGFYRETYRSDQSVSKLDRHLMTVIYFLLTSENVSKFHRIKSDEIWFFHAGSPLIVHTLDEYDGHRQHLLGLDFQAGEYPQVLVPKNTIFGSTVKQENAFSLVSCTVSPGFSFEDFELFGRDELLKNYPNASDIIWQLT